MKTASSSNEADEHRRRPPAERPQSASEAKRGVKDAMEFVMHALFLVCGLVAIAFVLVIIRISHHLRHARHPRGGVDRHSSSAHDWDLRQQERRPRLRHPAHDPHQHLRHRRGHRHRRAHRLPHGRVPLQGGQPQGGRRHPRGGGPAGRHPQRRLRPGGHDGPAARHPRDF